MEPVVQQDEPPSSTGGGTVSHGPGLSPMNHTNAPNGNILPNNKFEYDRDKTDLIPTTLWNSTTGKLSHHKQATVNTPDGKNILTYFYYCIVRGCIRIFVVKLQLLSYQYNIQGGRIKMGIHIPLSPIVFLFCKGPSALGSCFIVRIAGFQLTHLPF